MNPSTQLYAGGRPGPTISDETVQLVRAAMADTTRAITAASGLIGYELEAPAKVIVPVITPLVNMLPRRKGTGIDIVHWKAITSFDTARGWGTLADGGTPSQVTYAVAQMQNTIQTIALMNQLSFQAQWRGRSLEADVRARRTAELLYQLTITEEKWLLGASTNLMTPPAPLTATAATGGSVTAATYWVQVTAKNAQSETLGSNATKIVTTGATSTITVSIFTVPNATQYNVYIGSGATPPAAADGRLALTDIDNLLAAMYLQAAGDPDYIIMNPLDNIRLTNLVVGAGQLRYVVQSTAGDQGDLTAQYRVTRYLNKTTGKEMPIILDRYCPQGNMVFLPMSIPYPVPEISNALEIETNQEYWGVDFAITDSNFKFADYVDETVKVYFLGGLGVLRGIFPAF